MTLARYNSDAQLHDEAVNLHVGRRLRRRRRIMGLTQADLGAATRIRFQQVQKYECAANRISAARLFLLATALQVPVQYFFDGLLTGPANDHSGHRNELVESSEGREVLEVYYRLPTVARKKLIAFMKSLSEPSSPISQPEPIVADVSQLDEDVINLHVGRRLRRRRRIMGLTQADLGAGAHVQFQQVQKYECAANRISAARLFLLATTLQVPVHYFFEGLLAGPANDHVDHNDELAEPNEAREVLEVYYRLPPVARKKLMVFMKSLSEPDCRN